jgi:hypothetical protein
MLKYDYCAIQLQTGEFQPVIRTEGIFDCLKHLCRYIKKFCNDHCITASSPIYIGHNDLALSHIFKTNKG